MNSIIKISAISIVSAALMATTGCATKRADNTRVAIGTMGVPTANSYGGGSLVNNSADIQAAAKKIQGIVYFDFDSSELRNDAMAVLNQQIEFLAANPTATVLVAGHTDERGSREYNHALGERRAQTVKNYLLSKGIQNARVETISYGEDRPAVDESNEAAYSKNRRAELAY